MRFFRLWCGRKRYTPWLDDEREVWRIAVRKGLAYEDADGNAGLGPLTWIEVGERKYPRAKTVTISRRGYPWQLPSVRLADLATLAFSGLFYVAMLAWPIASALD